MGEFDDLDTMHTSVDGDGRDTLQDVFPEGAPPMPLEVVFARDTFAVGQTGGVPDRYRALEIWTQNRIYVVDSTLTCMDVLDRATGASTPGHSLIGARLCGGQRKYGKTLHVARPFPVPGTEAVFERAGSRQPAGVTSKVERVRLFIRVSSLVLEDQGAWDDVTASLLQPGFGVSGR